MFGKGKGLHNKLSPCVMQYMGRICANLGFLCSQESTSTYLTGAWANVDLCLIHLNHKIKPASIIDAI